MSTACHINVYNSHVDRGTKVTTTPLEHYEVDESGIVVGKPLPKLWSKNTVTAYDDNQLDLEIYGKTFTIKVGEEVEVASSSYDVGMGVSSCKAYCIKLIATEIVYKGGWQWGDTIRQELAGPIGDGEVFYPNGDHFKGVFLLSYASINGPAYAAEGRYTFADGSYIEHAWINTSKDKKPEWWGLHGVFRIKHPSGDTPDSIAMFLHGGRRYGFELFLGKSFSGEDNPWVREWYAGDKIVRYQGPDDLFRYEVLDWQLDEASREDCTTLRLTLRAIDGKIYKVEQMGGDYELNKYDNRIYKLSTRVTLWLPNGDSIDHYGDDVKDFQSYDGYVEVHQAEKAQWRREHWEKGKLVEAGEWRRDWRASKRVTLPDPTGVGAEMQANVWADGHISYNHNEWVYDGEVKNDRPDGQGMLVGDDYHGKRRYEGKFVDGQYVNDEETFMGKVMLHVRSGHKSWSVYSNGEWKYNEYDIEAKLGKLDLDGFWNYEITKITQEAIIISFYDETYTLTPDQPLHLFKSIDGDEYSDGCVYDGDDYSVDLTWINI